MTHQKYTVIMESFVGDLSWEYTTDLMSDQFAVDYFSRHCLRMYEQYRITCPFQVWRVKDQVLIARLKAQRPTLDSVEVCK